MEHRNEKVIMGANMASFLVLNGCKLNHTKRCLKNPKKYIYFFENNSRLRYVIKIYSNYRDSLYNIQKEVLSEYANYKEKGVQEEDERL